jgi:hypothetical protein
MDTFGMTIQNTIEVFTTDNGTYNLEALLQRLHDADNYDTDVAAEIIKFMLPDFLRAQSVRDRMDAIREELAILEGL